jgi:tetratricopeptide (TPR) repeat protein
VEHALVSAYSGRFGRDAADAAVLSARTLFGELGDELGLAWTGLLEFYTHWLRLQAAAAAEAALRAEEHARAAGDTVLAGWIRHGWGMALAFGPIPAGDAIEKWRPFVESTTSVLDRAERQLLLGKILAMLGEVEEARALAREGIEGVREAGKLAEGAGFAQTLAFIETRAGSDDTADAELRQGIAELDRLGNRGYRNTCALRLAELLASRGAYDEAARWCAEVRGSLDEHDLTDVIGIDALEGFLLAVAGSADQSEQLSARAVELADTTDFYEARAHAYEWRARTLALLDKPAEARKAAATALAIYEAKGDRPASAWARELLDSLPA